MLLLTSLVLSSLVSVQALSGHSHNHKRIAILPSDSPYRVSEQSVSTNGSHANRTVSLGTKFDNSTLVGLDANATSSSLPALSNSTEGVNGSIPILWSSTPPPSNETTFYNSTTYFNETLPFYLNGTALNGTIVFPLTNGTTNSSSSIGSILSSSPSVLPTAIVVAPLAPSVSVSVSATTTTTTDYETKTETKTVDHFETVQATKTAWIDHTVTVYATEHVTEVRPTIKTKTVSEVKTVSAVPTHRAGLSEMMSVLNGAASAAAAMPVVTVTLVPDQSDGHWTYVVASASSPDAGPAVTTHAVVAPKPSPVAAATTALPVAYSPLGAPFYSPPVVKSSAPKSPALAPSRTVVSSGLGSGQDTIQPTLPAEVLSAIISSLAPTSTPTFTYSLPGSTGTIVIGSAPNEIASSSRSSAARPTKHQAGTSIVSAAVASATAQGALVGPILSPGGSDEPVGQVEWNSTVIIGVNSTMPYLNSTIVSHSDWNSTLSPSANVTVSYGNSTTSLSNSTLILPQPLFNGSSIMTPNMTLPLPPAGVLSNLTSSNASGIVVVASPSSVLISSSSSVPVASSTEIKASSSESAKATRSASASHWSSAFASASASHAAASSSSSASASASASAASAEGPAITQTIQMGSASLIVVIPSPTLAVISSSFIPTSSLAASSKKAAAASMMTIAPSGMAKMRRS